MTFWKSVTAVGAKHFDAAAIGGKADDANEPSDGEVTTELDLEEVGVCECVDWDDLVEALDFVLGSCWTWAVFDL